MTVDADPTRAAAGPTPAPDAPARRRLDPDTRRSEILAAAVRIYAERPYADVATGELAAAAGVARGLLNHYFGTKRALYIEALRVLLTIPEQTAADLPGESSSARAGAAVDWFLATVEARRGLWLAVGLGSGGEPDVVAVVEDTDEVAVARLLRALRPGHRAAGDAPRARAFFGLVRAASREWLVRGSLDRDGVRDLLVTTLLALFPEEDP